MHILNFTGMEEDIPRCLECGAILYGRPDKKFCTTTCKNRYNNRLRSRTTRVKNRIINILLKNHEILTTMDNAGKRCADLADLALDGFVPSCITGYRKGRYNHDEYACFDFRFCLSGSRLFNLHRIDVRSENREEKEATVR